MFPQRFYRLHKLIASAKLSSSSRSWKLVVLISRIHKMIERAELSSCSRSWKLFVLIIILNSGCPRLLHYWTRMRSIRDLLSFMYPRLAKSSRVIARNSILFEILPRQCSIVERILSVKTVPGTWVPVYIYQVCLSSLRCFAWAAFDRESLMKSSEGIFSFFCCALARDRSILILHTNEQRY